MFEVSGGSGVTSQLLRQDGHPLLRLSHCYRDMTPPQAAQLFSTVNGKLLAYSLPQSTEIPG